MYGGGEKSFRLGLVEKFKGQRPYGRPRCRRDYNCKMDLKEIVWEGLDWIALAYDRDKWRALMNSIMNHRFHKMRGISLLDCDLFVSEEQLCCMQLISWSY